MEKRESKVSFAKLRLKPKSGLNVVFVITKFSSVI